MKPALTASSGVDTPPSGDRMTHISQTALCLSIPYGTKSDLLDEVFINLWVNSEINKLSYIWIDIQVESDGKKAYVKILDTPESLFHKAIAAWHSEEYTRSILYEYNLDI